MLSHARHDLDAASFFCLVPPPPPSSFSSSFPFSGFPSFVTPSVPSHLPYFSCSLPTTIIISNHQQYTHHHLFSTPRFLSGMGLGLVLATTSVYIVEIATTDMRVNIDQLHTVQWKDEEHCKYLSLRASLVALSSSLVASVCSLHSGAVGHGA